MHKQKPEGLHIFRFRKEYGLDYEKKGRRISWTSGFRLYHIGTAGCCANYFQGACRLGGSRLPAYHHPQQRSPGKYDSQSNDGTEMAKTFHEEDATIDTMP